MRTANILPNIQSYGQLLPADALQRILVPLAFCGSPHNAEWLSESAVPELLAAVPALPIAEKELKNGCCGI